MPKLKREPKAERSNFWIYALGFEPCDGYGNCDRCGATGQELYFGNASFEDAREGDYLCMLCLRKMKRSSDELRQVLSDAFRGNDE